LSDWLNRVNKFDPRKTILTIPRAVFFSVELVRNLFISINTNERSMRKLLFLLACFFLASIGLVSAQSVSGKVISDEDGQPIVGATVAVKGTTIGTLTNGDGVFTVNLRGNSKTLLVTSLGMLPIEVQAVNNMVIKMQVDRMMIDEVIVTGLGIKRSEKALGYAASAVTAADITATGNRSAFNALQGKIPGVEINSASGAPGSSTRIIMRGFTSLSGSNQPLYVIDGVPMNNDVISSTSLNGGMDFGNRANDINPEDIESMTVLQSGAGTALYGSRASSGVILITTKNGSKAGSKAKVDFSSTTTFETPLRLPLMQNEYGQGWYDRSTEPTADLQENGSWGPKFDGVVRKWGFVIDNQQLIKPYSALKTNISDFFDVGTTLNNNIAISNGDDKKSFYLSYGNITSDGIMPSNSDSYKRNNIALRGNVKLFDFLNASASLNYVRKDSKFVITGQEQSVLDALWQSPRDMSIVDQKDYNNKFYNVDNFYNAYAQNPYYVLNEHGTQFGEDRVFGNVGLEAKLLPWLSASFKVGGDASNSTLKSWRAITKSVRYDYNKEDGRVAESSYYSSEMNSDFMLTASKKINSDIDVKAVVGTNYNERKSRSISASIIGLDIPFYYNLANSSKSPVISDDLFHRRLLGLYGSVDLSYKNYLFWNISGRQDQSSTLPKENSKYFYPGTSLSFIFTELMEDKSILSYGKIRAGAGITGKDAPMYVTSSILFQGTTSDGYRTLDFPLTNGGSTVNGFTVSGTLGNNTLKPEMSQDLEVGLDLKFLDNRIATSVSLYNKTITDLIFAIPIPASTGYTSQYQNIGRITNKGVEISLTLTPIRSKDIEWEIYSNYSKNSNMLDELAEGLDVIHLGGTSSMNYVARPGQPLGLYEGTVVAKDADGHTIVNATGLPTFESEYQVLGTSQNNYRIGGGSSLRYKNYRIHASVDYRNGGKMYSRTAEIMYFTGNALPTTYNDRQPFIIPNSVQVINGVSVENTTPISGFANNLNQYYNQTYNAGIGAAYSLVDKTFFKLREVTVTYTVPKTVLPKQISSLELSLVGNNLLLWTPNSNLYTDPEQTTFGNDLTSDFGDFGATPTTRSFGFNVRLGF
jgi:TonB-linked SusC/RagA family outer membrane protein